MVSSLIIQKRQLIIYSIKLFFRIHNLMKHKCHIYTINIQERLTLQNKMNDRKKLNRSIIKLSCSENINFIEKLPVSYNAAVESSMYTQNWVLQAFVTIKKVLCVKKSEYIGIYKNKHSRTHVKEIIQNTHNSAINSTLTHKRPIIW